MSFSKVHSGQSFFLKGTIVDIEVDLSRGLHSFSIVGLPDKSVDEARDRISAAIKNSGFVSPKQKNHRVVISLAPADVKKEGTHFDLAMALGYVRASGDIRFDPTAKIFIGELSLDGALRKVRGVLSVAMEAKERGFKELFVPFENVHEAALVEGLEIFGARNFSEVVEHLKKDGNELSPRVHKKTIKPAVDTFDDEKCIHKKDKENDAPENVVIEKVLEKIIGQELAKRGLEIAAAGGHNILMSGPPGTGKTLLANALRSLLPKLSREHALEVTSIYSVIGLTDRLISEPPFRAPHHTTSHIALLGGGNIPRPGEITLAHRGVLFLDEFTEFERRAIETLRQPLESRKIHIARAHGSTDFPAHFMLVAAMNPCPCGFSTSRKKNCTCSAADIARYRKKISGPILDRIDLSVEVGDIEYSEFEKKREMADEKISGALGLLSGAQELLSGTRALTSETAGETAGETERVIQRITRARELQRVRFSTSEHPEKLNSDMSGEELSLRSTISPSATATLLSGAESFNLSMRSYHRVWRVARTIADLDNSDTIKEPHVLEALQYRRSVN